MALRLKYQVQTSVPLEVPGVVPDAVCEKSPSEIERIPVFHGNRQLPLGEFFAVSGSAADRRIDFEGDLSGVHWIGAQMAGGEIRVEGPAGRHLGSEMSGGRIHVTGDAGDWTGAEMRGGFIRVDGRAGDLVGSAYRGSARGMTGGAIVVAGDAGDEVAHSMRRGIIAIGGSLGDAAAVSMIAGSLFVCGGCGVRPAAGMRRGSVVLLGADPRILPTFKPAGHCRPLYLRIFLAHLVRLGLNLPGEAVDCDYRLYHGDLLSGGRGELLIRAC
ncbi:MAG TPA: formylmethanofuran dehydrogenase subunit C [Pirellulales bacterium]|nr:formylmethanofuran dehydrogenase subunit C [Pirellulales bacterium]